MMRTFFFMTTCLLGSLSAFAQIDDSASRATVQAAYEAKGIHFEHVNAMVQMIAAPESEPSAELLKDFLRTIETAQQEGAPSPMSAEWQDRWMSTYNLSAEQVQDLYKAAVRFALQPGRR
jgi:acyl-CoA thioesterase